MDNNKVIFSDQYNIPWNILDKRSQMIASYSNYNTRLVQFKIRDLESKAMVISCINYLYNELKSLKNTKIKNIKEDEDENLISYDTAKEIYNLHMKEHLPWKDTELNDMFNFILEACRECGIADPGYHKIDYSKVNVVRGLNNGQVFE